MLANLIAYRAVRIMYRTKTACLVCIDHFSGPRTAIGPLCESVCPVRGQF